MDFQLQRPDALRAVHYKDAAATMDQVSQRGKINSCSRYVADPVESQDPGMWREYASYIVH